MANLSLVFDLLAKDNASPAFKNVGDAAERAGKQGEGFGSSISNGVKAAGAALAAAGIFAGIKSVIGASSDLNETLNKSNVIFGSNAASINAWAGSAAKNFGLSKQAALEAASGLGNMLTQLGYAPDAAAEASKSTVKLAADLGSFNNLETGDVLDRIGGAMRGEYDSLQLLIPNINAARVEQEAMAATGKTSADSLTAQEKAAATLAIVQRDGAAASNDFAETNGGLANQSKIAAAQFEDLKAKIGDGLAPVMASVMGFITTTALPALSNLGAGAKQVFDIMFRGDFTGGPLAEDSPIVDKLFNLRDGLVTVGGVAKQAFDILFRGDFSGGPLAEDSKTVDVLFRLRDGFVALAGFMTGDVVPAFVAVGSAVGSVAEFFAEHQSAMIALGAVVGAVLATMVAAWIAQAAVSIASSASSVAAWFALATAATTSSTIQSRSTAQIVVGWIAAAASSVASAATVVAGWVLMGTQSLIQAARMAAAWFIALGPIGWVTAAIVAIAALVIANWDTIVKWTKIAWSAVTDFLRMTWDWIKSAASAAIGFLVNLFLNFTGPGLLIKHFDTIKAGAENAWHWVVDKFTAMKDGVISIFTTIRDTVGTVWDGLLGKVKTPIKVVFDFVNGNMIGPINSLLGKFPGGLHIDDLPHLAGGGIVRGPGTGTSDSILGIDPRTGMPTAMVSNGEMVVNAEATKRNRSLLEAMNLGYYAKGGEIGGPLDWAGNAVGAVVGGAKKAAGAVIDFGKDIAEKGARKVAELIVNPLRNTAKGLIPGGNVIGDVVRGFIDKMADSVLGKATDADSVAVPAGGGSVGGTGWAALLSTVKKAFPDARANSTYRPGDPGYHGLGQALDIGKMGQAGGNGTPFLAAVNQWIADNFPNSRELIYDGAGDNRSDIKNGRAHTYNAATQAQHRNHVHWVGPSYQTGTSYVPVTAPALLHKGEAVLTAAENAARNSAGGGATFHIYDVNGVLMGSMRGQIADADRQAALTAAAGSSRAIR